ncbi:hypothetical protein ElyMa_002119000, partial [Elysia marginata]
IGDADDGYDDDDDDDDDDDNDDGDSSIGKNGLYFSLSQLRFVMSEPHGTLPFSYFDKNLNDVAGL